MKNTIVIGLLISIISFSTSACITIIHANRIHKKGEADCLNDCKNENFKSGYITKSLKNGFGEPNSCICILEIGEKELWNENNYFYYKLNGNYVHPRPKRAE